MTDIVEDLLVPYTQDQSRRVVLEAVAAHEIERLREAVTRLLACPAIADVNWNDPDWGCAETLEAETFARAALAGTAT